MLEAVGELELGVVLDKSITKGEGVGVEAIVGIAVELGLAEGVKTAGWEAILLGVSELLKFNKLEILAILRVELFKAYARIIELMNNSANIPNGEDFSAW